MDENTIKTKYIASLKLLETLNWDLIEAAMRDIYAENLEFKDPLFHKHSLNDFITLYKHMVKGAKAIKVTIIQDDSTQEEIIIGLTLEYFSKILLKFRIVQAHTHIKFKDGKVFYRFDRWGIKNIRLCSS